jgi:hypothetical protein
MTRYLNQELRARLLNEVDEDVPKIIIHDASKMMVGRSLGAWTEEHGSGATAKNRVDNSPFDPEISSG